MFGWGIFGILRSTVRCDQVNDLHESKRNSRTGHPCYQYEGYNRGGSLARATEVVVFLIIAREAIELLLMYVEIQSN